MLKFLYALIAVKKSVFLGVRNSELQFTRQI